MACRTPADPQLIYGEIDASLSSAAIDRLKRANLNCNEENSEPDTSTSGEESHIGSEGEETSTEQRTFLVIVNDDGSFTLDSSGVIVKNADPDTVIPVTLPLNKMKSVEQPLPGARTLPTTGRSRKTKLQARTGLNSESDPSYEFVAPSSDNSEIPVIDLEDSVSPLDIHLPNARGVLVSGTISLEAITVSPSVSPIPTPASVIVSNPANSTPSIDLTDFTKQLDPQSLANLENVLQSEQAREILETLTFDEEVSGVTNGMNLLDALKSESAQPLWDHSYSQSVSSTRTVITGPSPAVGSTSVIVPVQSVIQTVSSSNSPPSVVTVRRESVSKPSAVVNSPSPAMPPVITVNNNPKGRPSSGSSSSGGSRRVSEADRESNANIRRSQRQQDRIERQEAERIMAENQQMLQREKEIMKEAKSVSVVSSPINSVGQTVQHSVVTEVSVVATPLPVPVAPLPATPVAVALVEDTTTPKSESGRPKRQNRKLPAHLADPNYVHFDEDVKIVKEVKTIENEAEAEVKEEPDDELTILEGDDEDVTEDDPNRLWCICRQPHNNRFMICCDKCEEWFHGKCVGVTKAQGKAMELKQMLWHCPNCKKELRPPAKINQKQSVIVKRNSDSTPTASEKPAGVRKVGRPPKNKAVVTTPVSSKVQETVTEITPKQIKKKINTPPAKPESVSEKANNCMVCGKSARKDSAYCSDKCVQKWAESVGSKVSVVPPPTKPAASIPTANAVTPAPTTPAPIVSAPPTPTTTPAASSPPNQKLKRANSLKQLEPEKATPFLTFHVISSGSTKSTETVPPRPKELTASALLKQSQQQQSTTTPQKTPTTPISPTVPNILPTVPGIGPNSVNTIAIAKPVVVANKVVDGENKLKIPFKGSPLKIDTALPQSQPTQIQSPTTPVGSKRSRTSSESSSSKAQKVTIKKEKEPQHRPKEKEKEIERDGPTSEKLLRENMRKTIREVLKNRLKDLDDDEKKILESSGNTADIMAEKIEEELCRCYGGASNPKCKAKYRSIYFNFKDNKNSLFREILAGNIKPKVLVRMEPQQMASAELTEWRLKENRKELDAIKRAELDKLAEAKKQQLIDSGVDDAVVVAEETRPKDITDVIDADKEKSSAEKDKKEKKDGSHSHSSHRRDKDKRSKDKDRDDKRRDSKDHGSSSSKDKDRRDREKDKDSRRRSSRHRHRSGEKSKERDREKERRHKEKDGKESTRSSKSDTHSEISRRDSESSKHADKKEITKIPEEENKMDDTSKTSYSGDDSTPTQQQTTPTENSKSDPRHSTDTEQEQPSSTIKTPDFIDDGLSLSAQFSLLNGTGCKPIFNSTLTMQELGNLGVAVYDVSHVGLEGTLFPEAPVPFVGRISPDTVWDYINKMKKTKEVIIFRLAPATQADTAIYNSFYDYLHGRGRLGVLGSINHPLKDVYLCPLDKHTPMNRSLLPFRGGPGIPKERTNSLLAIVTRHIVDPNHQALKRKGSISGDVGKKKLKVESEKSGAQKSASGNNSKVATRKISMDVKVENPLPDGDVELTEATQDKVENSEVTKDDDDEPYTPWEDDDVEVDVKPVPPVSKPDTHKLLEELNAKIERERQEIENIAGAISNRKNLTGIPGLDGDFPDSPSPKIVTKPIPEQVPFFLRSTKDVSMNSGQSRDTQPVNIPGLDMEVESSFTPKKTQEVVDIKDDDDDYDDEEPVEIFTPSQTYAVDPRRREPVAKLVTSTPVPIVPQPSEIIPGLSNDATDNPDSEAYSPSAVHFSDDEDKKDLDDENDSRETIVDDTDEELLPPGVEKESTEAPLTSPIKPVFKLEDPRLSVTMTSQAEEIEKSSTASLMELEDDSEPPPPGETSAPSTPIKINLPNVFESPSADDLPFPSMVVLSKASQKVKININLSTKILPAPKENEDQNANKSEAPGLKIQRQLPALKPMQKSNTTATPPSPQQVQPPSPAMPKLHQLPPCIPALQKAPMVPGLALPIQMPPPPLQNIPPIPLQIPPPNLQQGPPPPRISLGININVPPPPLTGLGIIPQIPGIMSRGMPPLTPGGIRFPPPTSIPPPPIIAKNEGSLNPAATVVGGVRRPFIPPIPNPLAKPSLRPNTPRIAPALDVNVIDNSNKIPRTSTPEKTLDHNIRGRDRESRFDRNNREGDIRESRFDRNRNEGDLDIDRRRPYQPGDRGRNFHRKPFDNRMRRRSRSDERSTRSRSSERRRRRGGRSSRSRSPPSWRRNRRSRSRSPRSSNRRFRTRSRSHSPSHDNKSPGVRRSANHLRSSRSKDKSRSRSRSPKRFYSRRSRSKSNSKSRSPSVSSKTVKTFSTEKSKSPPPDGKSPIIGSREEDWEDDPDDVSGSQTESHPESHSEKESSFEFSGDKKGAVAIHLSPEIVQMD